MSENKHTPEPWSDSDENMYVGELILSASCHPIYNNQGLIVGITFIRKDARRIVACVNACAGIPTEGLEPGSVEELAQLAAWKLDLLSKQRDELLAALVQLRQKNDDGWQIPSVERICSKAIASVEGGA